MAGKENEATAAGAEEERETVGNEVTAIALDRESGLPFLQGPLGTTTTSEDSQQRSDMMCLKFEDNHWLLVGSRRQEGTVRSKEANSQETGVACLHHSGRGGEKW